MVKPATPIGPADYRIVYEDGMYFPQRRGIWFGFWWSMPEVYGNGKIVWCHHFEWQAMEVIEDHIKARKFKSKGKRVREFYNTSWGIQDARNGDIINVREEREAVVPPPPPKK